MNVPVIPRWWAITRMIFLEADTTTTRMLLGTASFIYMLILALNSAMGHHLLDRPAYALMNIFGGDLFWGILFVAHGIGVLWRFYTARSCVLCAIAVNLFGCCLWTYTTVAVNVSIGFLSPTFALEIPTCILAWWVLYRTGMRDEVVSP